jgi:hypothetical protein
MAAGALVVSILALLMSSFLYWRQAKWAKVAANAQQQAASAQEQLAAIEEARHTIDLRERERAALSVHFEPVGTDSHMIVVRNDEGPATAYDVAIDLAPRAAGVAPELLNCPFPATIPPRAEATALLSESLATATQLTGTLKWTDGEGPHEEHFDLSIR